MSLDDEIEEYQQHIGEYRVTPPKPVLYHGLEIQPTAKYITCKKCGEKQEKDHSSFDHALWSIQYEGYERFLSPAEAAGIARARLKMELSDTMKAVADDMFTDKPEYVSAALRVMKRGYFWKKKILVVYPDPYLSEHGDKYDWAYGAYGKQKKKHEYDITGKGNPVSIYVKDLPDGMQHLFYGCLWKDMPPEMQNARICFPLCEGLSPLLFGGDYEGTKYSFVSAVGIFFTQKGAIRGVREIKA